MPFPALSLVGFLCEADALAYFQQACVMPNSAPGALRARHQQAKKKLGNGAVPKPGRPDVQPLPLEYESYLECVENNPRFASTVGDASSWSYQLIEIEPLLAYQIHVLVHRVDEVVQSLGQTPSLADCLNLCLPHQLEAIPFAAPRAVGNVLLIESPSLNLAPHGLGLHLDPATQLSVGGLSLGASSPLVHVVHWAGHYYLRNGYHRACGLAKVGATHIPCILLEGSMPEQAVPPGRGFPASIVTGVNPPTVGHFTRGLAHEVNVRRFKKLIEIEVSCRERVEPDE